MRDVSTDLTITQTSHGQSLFNYTALAFSRTSRLEKKTVRHYIRKSGRKNFAGKHIAHNNKRKLYHTLMAKLKLKFKQVCIIGRY